MVGRLKQRQPITAARRAREPAAPDRAVRLRGPLAANRPIRLVPFVLPALPWMPPRPSFLVRPGTPSRSRAALRRSNEPSNGPSAQPACSNFRGSRFHLWKAVQPSASVAVSSWFLPRIRRSPCDTESAAKQRGCRGSWIKWKGPASAERSEAETGSGPFMPRKALVPARAALRFAHRATDGCGAPDHHRLRDDGPSGLLSP